jgi:hypothetical protein
LALLLCRDQLQRWRNGERPRVEDYLTRHPHLAGDAVLQLLIQEFLLRQKQGEPATVEPTGADRPQPTTVLPATGALRILLLAAVVVVPVVLVLWLYRYELRLVPGAAAVGLLFLRLAGLSLLLILLCPPGPRRPGAADAGGSGAG